ncbi:tRNA glutamyl-Q(34) synthetase GluQRS [Parvularcula sp. IMCC14364]|uniref:tRNA glutamyl-Q(34) synthetase GluQRS n=1 Tax=Parvularcula sp. IMCC14364 TaxID=3067902 RepID=UPI0027428C04|nr:tRNA glutamyl-Q(34) synthetase GluQRS [Parvularcula sp. IMCC14364]
MFRTRFAPSPTGYLHLGHALSALTVAHFARQAGGEMLLRIENTDFTRCRDEYESAIFDDLDWLGLDWPTPVRRQTAHFPEYKKALQKLIDAHVVYRCFLSRKELMTIIDSNPEMSAHGPDGPVYFGQPLPASEEAHLIEQGTPFAWRLSIRAARDMLCTDWSDISYAERSSGGEMLVARHKATPEIFGDAVIARKDIGTSYHLASVHDDALQGITHVIRGDDLKQAVHLHRLLQVLLDLPEPVYQHHRLLTDDAGKKLSKRDESPSLKQMRESGVRTADVKAQIADLLQD